MHSTKTADGPSFGCDKGVPHGFAKEGWVSAAKGVVLVRSPPQSSVFGTGALLFYIKQRNPKRAENIPLQGFMLATRGTHKGTLTNLGSKSNPHTTASTAHAHKSVHCHYYLLQERLRGVARGLLALGSLLCGTKRVDSRFCLSSQISPLSQNGSMPRHLLCLRLPAKDAVQRQALAARPARGDCRVRRYRPKDMQLEMVSSSAKKRLRQ